MENQVTRKQFARLLPALTKLSEKGNLEFDDWIKVEEFRLKLEEIKEREDKILQKIMDSTGYTKYSKMAKELYMKNVKKYIHTDEDLKAIEDFTEKAKEFDDSMIAIGNYKISKKIIKNLPDEVLDVRMDLLPIIELGSKKTAESSKK